MSRLPLFPLSTPLFPQQHIDLQIFEQRYLTLISNCLKGDENFGVVQIREGREVGATPQIFQFGVEAAIVDWRQQPNGLLGIRIEGRRKFTVASTTVQGNQLMLADISWLPDEPRETLDDRHDGLVELYQQLRQHPLVAHMQLPEARYSCELGWHLSQLLPFPAPDKVDLLSMHDPEQRLQAIEQRLRKMSED